MPNDVSRSEIETTFSVGDREVAACVRLPASASASTPVPGVVFVDGSGPSDRHHFGPQPRWFVDAGFAVVTHDKPGCGETSGDWRRQSIPGRAQDTRAALNAVRSLDEVAHERVGLWAASQGGWVAPIAAAANSGVAFMILVSSTPVSPYEQEGFSLEERMRRAGEPREEIAAAIGGYWDVVARLRAGEAPERIVASLTASDFWHRYFPAESLTDPGIIAHFGLIGDHDPLAALAGVRCPVLLVWGEEDPVIPVEQSRRIFLDRLDGADVTVEVFPGADHRVSVAAEELLFAPGYVETTTEWARARAGID